MSVKRVKLRAYQTDLANHTLHWEQITSDEARNGGHELYRLLCEHALDATDVHGCVVGTLRMLNREFRTTADPLILKYAKHFNATVLKPLQELIWLEEEHKKAITSTPLMSTNWNAKQQEYTARRALYTPFIVQKFGERTSKALVNCMFKLPKYKLEQDEQQMYRCPSIVKELAAFLPAAGDYCTHICDTSVVGFLAMAMQRADTCALHAFSDMSKCCEKACTNKVPNISYVPHGHGLIIQACPSCLMSESVALNIKEDNKELLCGPCDRFSYTISRKWDDNYLRHYSMAHAMMLQKGLHLGDKVSEIKISHTFDNCEVDDENPLLFLMRYALGRVTRVMMADNLVDNPLFSKPWTKGGVLTFCQALQLSNTDVQRAKLHIKEVGEGNFELESMKYKIVEKMTFGQLDDLLTEAAFQHGAETKLTVEKAERMLPGSLTVVKREVVDEMMKHSRFCAHSVEISHVVSYPNTRKLVRVLSLATTQLRRLDLQLAGSHASPHAYAYVTGMCCGNDMNFSKRELSAQVNFCAFENESLVQKGAQRLVELMHVFDAMDYETIRVTQGDPDEDDEFPTFRWSFQVCNLCVSGSLVTPKSHSWFSDIQSNVTYAHLQGELGDDIHSSIVKTEPFPAHRNMRYNDVPSVEQWLDHTARQLCARPETRALGLDVLTHNQPHLMFAAVESVFMNPGISVFMNPGILRSVVTEGRERLANAPRER